MPESCLSPSFTDTSSSMAFSTTSPQLLNENFVSSPTNSGNHLPQAAASSFETASISPSPTLAPPSLLPTPSTLSHPPLLHQFPSTQWQNHPTILYPELSRYLVHPHIDPYSDTPRVPGQPKEQYTTPPPPPPGPDLWEPSLPHQHYQSAYPQSLPSPNYTPYSRQCEYNPHSSYNVAEWKLCWLKISINSHMHLVFTSNFDFFLQHYFDSTDSSHPYYDPPLAYSSDPYLPHSPAPSNTAVHPFNPYPPPNVHPYAASNGYWEPQTHPALTPPPMGYGSARHHVFSSMNSCQQIATLQWKPFTANTPLPKMAQKKCVTLHYLSKGYRFQQLTFYDMTFSSLIIGKWIVILSFLVLQSKILLYYCIADGQ